LMNAVLWTMLVIFLAVPVHAFAIGACAVRPSPISPPHRLLASTQPRLPVPLMQQQFYEQRLNEKALRRGSLVKPHVRAASLLLAMVLEFGARIARLRSPAARQLPRPPPPPAHRTSEPVFINGTLCEHVCDGDTGHEHWRCCADAAADTIDDLACRRSYMNGRFVWYCNKPNGDHSRLLRSG